MMVIIVHVLDVTQRVAMERVWMGGYRVGTDYRTNWSVYKLTCHVRRSAAGYVPASMAYPRTLATNAIKSRDHAQETKTTQEAFKHAANRWMNAHVASLTSYTPFPGWSRNSWNCANGLEKPTYLLRRRTIKYMV